MHKLVNVVKILMSACLGLYAAVAWLNIQTASTGSDTIPVGQIVKTACGLIAWYIGTRAAFWMLEQFSPVEVRQLEEPQRAAVERRSSTAHSPAPEPAL